MAVIQKKKIKQLEVTNDDNNVVIQVEIEWRTYDDSDPEEFYMEDQKRFTLETDEVNPTAPEFIAYGDLTQETVFGWLDARLNSKRIKEWEQRMIQDINDRVNPPEQAPPKTIYKELPW